MTRAIAAVAAGGFALALAFPAADLHLLAWVALVPLFVAVREGSSLRAWWLGVTFGLVFRVGSMHWVVDAMTQFGGLPLPAALAGALALFAYLAIFPGVFAVAVRRLGPADPATPLLAAAVWTGLELLQARLFTGFPWLLLGYAGGRSELLIQVADLAGVFGLSFLVVAVNGAIAAVAVGGAGARRPAIVTLVLVALAAGYGLVQLDRLPPTPPQDATIRVGLVQGNVAQDAKWDTAREREILDRHLRLTRTAGDRRADLVLWAESAWPDPWGLERSASGAAELRALAASTGASLIVGTVRIHEGADGVEVTNGAVMVTSGGEWGGAYEKVQLVPFGEFLPFRRWLGFLGPLVQAVGELRAGAPDQQLLADPSNSIPPVGLSICYEVIFPWFARDQVRDGAGVIATITNDAWYGRSSAPYQHFAMARMRAVETRRWLVRAANTGISGIVDPAGRVTARSGIFEEQLVTGAVAARTGLTPYVRFGDVFAWTCAIVGLLGLLVRPRTRDPRLRSTVRG